MNEIDEYYYLKPIEPKNKPMKTVLIVILSGIVAIPLVSWAIYGYSWEISAWFGLVAALGLVIVIVNKAKGTRPF